MRPPVGLAHPWPGSYNNFLSVWHHPPFIRNMRVHMTVDWIKFFFFLSGIDTPDPIERRGLWKWAAGAPCITSPLETLVFQK